MEYSSSCNSRSYADLANRTHYDEDDEKSVRHRRYDDPSVSDSVYEVNDESKF